MSESRSLSPEPSAGSPASSDNERSKSKMRHDLATPINQLIGYSEMLEEEAAASGQTQFIPDLKKIGSAARSLLSGIDRLLDSFGPSPEAHPMAMSPATDHDLPALFKRSTKVAERPASILVVDDNEMNRDMLSRRLERRGFEVSIAEDGWRALDLIDEKKFDLVLLDIMMPGMSGFQVLQIVRERHSPSELPVIMATAKDQGEDIVSAFKLGANDYVTKPIDFPVLLVRVDTQLSLKQAVEEVQLLAGELERRNKFIRRTFGRYLSEEVVESLLDTPEGLKLGGEKRTVTLLMSDLRAFSALSETLAPEKVVTMLNQYLGTMADIIGEHQGTIDEFIGDAILTIFGAPVERPDDPERAVACAMSMQLAMDSVNQKNQELGLPKIEMGIAVNTGEVVVGNIGSHKRSKYGVVGSQVNLTGRIESYTVGRQVLVSESTVNAVGSVLKLGERMSLGAKGLKDPVVVYDLRGIAGEYNLFLTEPQEELKTLLREIPLRINKLEGKRLDGEEFDGTMVRLSLGEGGMRSGEMSSQVPLAHMTDIRIRLTGLNGVIVPGDLYAKVVGETSAGYKVYFTSVPSDVLTFLLSILAAETA